MTLKGFKITLAALIAAFVPISGAKAENPSAVIPDTVAYMMVYGENGLEYRSREYAVRIDYAGEDKFVIEIDVLGESERKKIIYEDYIEGRLPQLSGVEISYACSQKHIIIETITEPPRYADLKSNLPRSFVINLDTGQFLTEYYGGIIDLFPLWNGEGAGYEVTSDFFSRCGEDGLEISQTHPFHTSGVQ